jgi:CheY-like chemotaxis protein
MPARILIIEDNPANLELMSFLLQAHGHTVLSAPDGESGVELACRERLDLILCDVQLPRLDGYGVVRELKAKETWWRVPLIAVTAFAMVGDRERMLGAGFDGYLPKPIEPEAFVREVEAFLRRELRASSPRGSSG